VGQQVSGPPTTSNLIYPEQWSIFKDTGQAAGQGVTLFYNDNGTMVAVGKIGDATGANTMTGLGTNSPATGPTPYTWLKFLSSDGSTVWVPGYK
jgi:hypothetical protein